MIPTAHRVPGRGRAAAAGAVAAGAALAAGQLPSALAGDTLSPVTAVGDAFVDRFAGPLKDAAVAIFGVHDKVALLAGIAVVSLLLGALLGVASLRRPLVGPAGLLAFGALGAAAGLTDPRSRPAVVMAGAVAGVAAGVVALRMLLRASSKVARAGAARGGAEPMVGDHLERRRFLALSGGIGLLALAGAAGAQLLRSGISIASQRAAIVLPRPIRTTRVPARGAVDVRGVSPYVTPTGDFYRIDTALITPQVDAGSWRLRIKGMVDNPFEVDFDELLAMDMVEEPVTLACVSNEVGGRLVGNARWLGVPLMALLDRAGVNSEATQIVGRSVDGFTAGFPTEVGTDGRVALVAVGMNGEPLTAPHGYPARLVVAGLYGYVSATKWLTEIELTRLEDFDGYWIHRGWSKEAPIKTQSRIDVPRVGDRVIAGSVPIAGVAWAPTRGITKVELQVDGGRWVSAELGSVASDNTWVQWVYAWDAKPGAHTIRVRATDGDGIVQEEAFSDPAPDGATGWHSRRVRVIAA